MIRRIALVSILVTAAACSGGSNRAAPRTPTPSFARTDVQSFAAGIVPPAWQDADDAFQNKLAQLSTEFPHPTSDSIRSEATAVGTFADKLAATPVPAVLAAVGSTTGVQSALNTLIGALRRVLDADLAIAPNVHDGKGPTDLLKSQNDSYANLHTALTAWLATIQPLQEKLGRFTNRVTQSKCEDVWIEAAGKLVAFKGVPSAPEGAISLGTTLDDWGAHFHEAHCH